MKKTIIYAALIFAGLSIGCQSKKTDTQAVQVSGTDASITIATVDTDSIFSQYDMVADVMKELENIDKKLTADLQNRAKNFQADYENYLKIGATMTLSEQKKKEEQLQKRQQELQQLEQKYGQQLMEARAQKNQEVQDKIFAFIETYNKANGNYSLVLSKSRTGGVLYSLPSMDITAPVLEALNADYTKNRKK